MRDGAGVLLRRLLLSLQVFGKRDKPASGMWGEPRGRIHLN